MAIKSQLKKDLNKSASEIKAKAEKAGAKVEQKSAEIMKAVEEKSTELKKATEDKAVEVKKATEEKAAEVKKAVKNAKKTITTKKDMKINITVQHMGKEVSEKEIIADVKKAFTKTGNKVGDIKSMDLYIKPEDAAVYYVINGSESGKIQL